MKKKPPGTLIVLEDDSLKMISVADRDDRSKVAEEIIDSKPDFLEKFGLSIFIGFLLLLGGGTCFIRYPDVVRCKALLMADGMSNSIGLPKPGKLHTLTSRNGAFAHRGDTLALIQYEGRLTGDLVPVVAPEDGVVHYTTFVQVGNLVETSMPLFEIVPENKRFYARIDVSQIDLSKLDTGMDVRLQIDAFPYRECGVVRGRLCYISNSISPEGCFAIVCLDKGLKTDFGKAITYKDGLTGVGLIVTKKNRLFQELYSEMFHLGQAHR